MRWQIQDPDRLAGLVTSILLENEEISQWLGEIANYGISHYERDLIKTYVSYLMRQAAILSPVPDVDSLIGVNEFEKEFRSKWIGHH